MDQTAILQRHLKALLDGGQAFDRFEEVVAEVPADKRFVIPEGAERSAWQIVEHMRISLFDIIEFSDNADGAYREKDWPSGYWPKESTPQNAWEWDRSVHGFLQARGTLEALLEEGGLLAPFSWGDGQTLLRQIMLAAEHTAYHCGELVLLTRWLGAL